MVRFVIIGGSEEEIKAHQDALRAAGVPEQDVIFLGMIPPDKLPAYLVASDILMAPRRAGVNTPLKVLDYFKAGGAIVATDTEANRFIMDSSCARLCEFNDLAFSKAIIELAERPDERASIASKGRKLYQDKFNFSVFSRLLSEAYDAMRGVT